MCFVTDCWHLPRALYQDCGVGATANFYTEAVLACRRMQTLRRCGVTWPMLRGSWRRPDRRQTLRRSVARPYILSAQSTCSQAVASVAYTRDDAQADAAFMAAVAEQARAAMVEVQLAGAMSVKTGLEARISGLEGEKQQGAQRDQALQDQASA